MGLQSSYFAAKLKEDVLDGQPRYAIEYLTRFDSESERDKWLGSDPYKVYKLTKIELPIWLASVIYNRSYYLWYDENIGGFHYQLEWMKA